MEDVEGCKEPGRRLQEAGTKCQAGMPGFLCVNRCSGIIRVWYSLLPPAFLWLARKGFGLSGPLSAGLSPAIALCQQAGQQALLRSQNSFFPWGSPGKADAHILLAPGTGSAHTASPGVKGSRNSK